MRFIIQTGTERNSKGDMVPVQHTLDVADHDADGKRLSEKAIGTKVAMICKGATHFPSLYQAPRHA